MLDGTLHTLTANQEQAKGEKPAANAEPATTAPQLAANQTGPMNTAETNVALQLSEQSFMMAQIGAFQAKDAADSVIAQLTKEGYPHFLYRQDD
ncbi:hypothetical protein MXD63_43395, partial [Frankia sp. Cpl3]|nr:hypothetical protein [Frankia sp. Cpl3]